MTDWNLESVDISNIPLLDESGVDWKALCEATYFIHQHIRYEYPGPITDLHQRLIIAPPDVHGNQRRLAQRLDVFPQMPAQAHRDAFGNSVISMVIAELDCGIDFEYWAIVERDASITEHRESRNILEMPSLLRSSLLTRADASLRKAADALKAEHSDPLELAHAINHFVFEHMRYEFGITDIHTTAASAFAHAKGVCQDYAHVMLAIARHCGLAARYVSGHLLGEGGTHAWVEIILPDRGEALVLAFDPTHDRMVTMKYIAIAVGRDYADVAPTSGMYTASFSGELSVRKRVGITQVRYAA